MTDRRTSWLEIQIEIDPEAADIVAALAADIADGVEVRDAGTVVRAAPGRALVIAHVAPAQREELLEALAETSMHARAAGVKIDPVVVREREAHEDEWRDVWKQFFRATRVGRSFIVRPSWDPGSIESADRVIDLDPGRAFGTGGHASTRLAIVLAEDLAETWASAGFAVSRFLDLGCGSGILSIAASQLWPEARGMAVDLDPEATACAGENFERNQVGAVALATGSLEVVPAALRFDLVLANIQADVLCSLAHQLPCRLAEGGHAILSGLLLRDADPVLGLFREAGFELVRRKDEGDWAALELRLAPAIRRAGDPVSR